MSKNLRFQYDPNQQYDIREFYEKFREKFPVWTMITEGNDGETTYDDFCSDTVRNDKFREELPVWTMIT